MRVIVYTAIFGGYDELKPPVEQDVPCDYLCFTDTDMPKRVGPWRVIHVPANPALHPRMQAKRFKLLSHEVVKRGRLPLATALASGLLRFRRYDASLWVDGSIAIKGSHFVRTCVDGLSAAELAMFQHPERDCIFAEARQSLTMEKYNGQRIAEQVAHYRRGGVVAHSGLFACGIIGRREPSGQAMKRFNTAWWDENVEWTFQDQLSVGVALSRSGMSVRPIPGNLWANDYFDWVQHASLL